MKHVLAMLLAMSLGFHAAYAGEVFDRVKSKGLIRIATDPAWPPYSWKDDGGGWNGFDPAVAEEIAKRIGVKLEFVTPNWDVITAGNWNDGWDLSIGGMTPTEERGKVLVFPVDYYFSPMVMAVNKNNTTIRSPADATGKRIGALTGSIFEKYVKREPISLANKYPTVYKINNPLIVGYDTSEAAYQDLAKGDGVVLDAMVDDLLYFLYLIKNGAPLKIVGQPLSYGPASLAIEPGDPEFQKLLKDTVTAMQDDGTLSALSVKWFGVDLTKKL